ncbi:glycosyl hydrolase family 5 [Aurantibacter crassamenti]|uniref:glycoside hydrolase family 2 TIM barrel-domain containing protein n=1 Tax=Aurantibacter crassamenti TaxID=1837375 RepID=UPI00193997F7|nr:glycoside hydrolase family 2 TIM barrel-domain containing protein [Aurantibacter crassamenti]MBM1107468.1 glycosyl hydrolase family 5 [Aurantibacter crassamenti]
MNKLTKTIYRVLLIASFLAINALILSGISAVLSYLNTGADKSSMLHLEVPMDKVYSPKVTWKISNNPGRTMEKQTLAEIEGDYLNAWHVRNIAFKKNDRYGVSDFYTDSAKQRVFEHIELNKKNKNWFKSTTLEHFPELNFYSEDGTLVVFTDKNVERYQETYQNDSLLYQQKDTTNYKVMMLLEDGFWRIRHFNQIENSKIIKPSINRNIKPILSSIDKIKGINYYPQKSPWDTFGKSFNDSIISNDFNIINEMGLNTIRIFIQYEDFGKANVKSNKLEKLKKVLDAASRHKLKVIITLFDFYGDYDVTNWTLTQRHAETIVTAVKNHPALLGWDIKNEPDLDFNSRGRQSVLSWLNEMNTKIKQWDPNHPITIGWSSPEAAINLANEVDYVSYHYYREPHNFIIAHNQLKSVVTDKPVVLQEYGYSSYDGFWNMYLGSDKKQIQYYTTMQQQLVDEKVPFVFWTLYDFEKVPTDVAGSLPWRTRKQHFFGCIDLNGNKKSVYEILKQP